MPPLSVFYFTLDPEHETVCFSPFDLYPQTVCANLFPIFSSIFDAILLYNKHCAMFLLLKAGKSSNRLYSFFYCLENSTILRILQSFMWYTWNALSYFSPNKRRWENNHMLLDRQEKLLFSCISNSEKIESIERLRLKCASGAHTVQAFFSKQNQVQSEVRMLRTLFQVLKTSKHGDEYS